MADPAGPGKGPVRGVPLLVAAAVMGHTNSRRLARVDTHVGGREEDLKAAVRKVRGGG